MTSYASRKFFHKNRNVKHWGEPFHLEISLLIFHCLSLFLKANCVCALVCVCTLATMDLWMPEENWGVVLFLSLSSPWVPGSCRGLCGKCLPPGSIPALESILQYWEILANCLFVLCWPASVFWGIRPYPWNVTEADPLSLFSFSETFL